MAKRFNWARQMKCCGRMREIPLLCCSGRGGRVRRRDFLEVELGQPPVFVIENHRHVQGAHMGGPHKDLLVVNEGEALGGQALEQLRLSLWRPTGTTTVLDMIDTHRFVKRSEE